MLKYGKLLSMECFLFTLKSLSEKKLRRSEFRDFFTFILLFSYATVLLSFRACKSWNGKDIQFINNIFKSNDAIHFEEVERIDEYRFGNIFVKDPEDPTNTRYTTLQNLLIKNGFAVKYEDFSKGEFLSFSDFVLYL